MNFIISKRHSPLLILLITLLSPTLFAGVNELPAPPTHWTLDSPNVVPVVGHRPYREGGIRIEKETLKNGMTVVHNYGHGGAGLRLSWGTVSAALKLAPFPYNPDPRNRRPIAIIGGGVIGLTTAYLLLQSGYSVTLYSDRFFPDNVSNVAGGLWSPVSVDLQTQDSEQARTFRRIQTQSYQIFDDRRLEGWPVKKIPLFVTEEAREKSGLDLFEALPDLFTVIHHEKIPIQGVQQAGYEVSTFLIDTPLYLERLIKELHRFVERNKQLKLAFVQRKFASFDELSTALDPNTLVFNCTGLGARELANDKNVIPVRGDLVYIKKTPNFKPSDYPYMVFYGKKGTDYGFFREGAVVVGGTFRKGDESTTVEPDTCNQKLESFRGFFGDHPSVLQ